MDQQAYSNAVFFIIGLDKRYKVNKRAGWVYIAHNPPQGGFRRKDRDDLSTSDGEGPRTDRIHRRLRSLSTRVLRPYGGPKQIGDVCPPDTRPMQDPVVGRIF